MRVALGTLGVLLGIAFSAQAGIVKEGATHFTTVGKVDSFQFLPESYRDADHPNEFFYDVYYYIPKKLREAKKAKALIFNHGGGPSTMNRRGSIETVEDVYLPELRHIANDLGTVVVLPSANGLNWGGHTVGLMRELARMLRAELAVDPDRIGLAGHSMGGMGITRSFQFLADQFAFFVPVAAGMDLSYAPTDVTEWQINKVFNVAYVHVQGLRDHFKDFIDRCREQLRRTRDLEAIYRLKSKLKMIFVKRGHGVGYANFRKALQGAFLKRRDLYQSQLWGTITTGRAWMRENGILFRSAPSPRYFWVEAVEQDVADSFQFYARADRVANSIWVELRTKPQWVRTLQVYLSSKFVDLTRPVEIFVDGVRVASRAAGVGELRVWDSADAGFLFEDSVDVAIPSF